MADMTTFLTTNKKYFKWPYSKPLAAKPAHPKSKTKLKNFFVKGPVDAYCHCDGHLYDPLMNKYLKLAEKEKLLVEQLTQLNAEMADIGNEILEHECNNYDDKMETTYQIDYIKRGLNPVQYITLMPAVDSPVPIPTKSASTGLGSGYRDPTMFRYSPFPRPTIDPSMPVTFASMPGTVDSWFKITTGRTEYQDTYGKVGLGIVKNRQQYAEPLPSSRRRYAEYNL